MDNDNKEVTTSDYLKILNENNPGLAKFWPGARAGTDIKTTPADPDKSQPAAAPVPAAAPEEKTVAKEDITEVATSVKRGCLPCSIGHLTACTGLLNEAMRFARKDGITSDQVLEDTSGCITELNAMERVDLRPEKIAVLPPWEKELVLEVLDLSKETRLGLESMQTPDDLEKIAANIQPRQVAIYKKWFRNKISQLSPDQKLQIFEKVANKVEDKI
jgi:hypothetical protein